MSYEFYKILHSISTMMVVMGLAGAAAVSANGISKTSIKLRKTLAITHGIGLVLALVAGFGLMARLQMMGQGFPIWITLKLVIWLSMGGLIALIYRKPQTSKWVWWVILLMFSAAAVLARTKIT